MKKFGAIFCVYSILHFQSPALSHDIYTGVTGKDGQLCCGEDDCFVTTYEEKKQHFFFRLKKEDGEIAIDIPADSITWTAIPGDDPGGAANKAHICYRKVVLPSDLMNPNFAKRIIDSTWLVFCAFIPPGAI